MGLRLDGGLVRASLCKCKGRAADAGERSMELPVLPSLAAGAG